MLVILTLDVWRYAAAAAFGLLITAMFLIPQRLIRSDTLGHVGIADGSPTVASYTAVICALALGAVGTSFINPARSLLPRTAALASLGLLVGLFVLWTPDAQETAGVLALLLGFAAWIVGAFLGPRLFASVSSIRIMAGVVLGAVAIETIVAALQMLGVPLFPVHGDAAAYLGARSNGTFEHPAILGKAVFCLQMIALVVVSEKDLAARRMAWGALLVGFIAQGLTQGRANILAAVLLVGAWVVLMPRARVSLNVRLAVPVALTLVSLPFVGAVASRFQEDPGGGPRGHLLAVAREQISAAPIAGVGPNDYVSTVAAFDQVAAQGFPVHNAFFLTAGELGLPMAALFWLPFAVLLVRAWKTRRSAPRTGTFAVVLLAAAPGFYVMLTTGWGFLTSPNFPLMCLTFGIFWAFVQPRSAGALDPSLDPSKRHLTAHE